LGIHLGESNNFIDFKHCLLLYIASKFLESPKSLLKLPLFNHQSIDTTKFSIVLWSNIWGEEEKLFDLEDELGAAILILK